MKQQQKNKDIIQFKEFDLIQVKADKDSRTVSGYLASFGNVDSDGDVIVKGAFSKSISERGPGSKTARKIAYLWQHDMKEPIGRFTLLEERDEGLYFEAEIDKFDLGDRVLEQYASGTLNQHSIGFMYVWERCEFVEEYEYDGKLYKDVFMCKELKLFEGSVVTMGANENTPFTGAKSLDTIVQEFDKLNQSAAELCKDQKHIDNEIHLRQIIHQYNQAFKSLVEIASHKRSASDDNEPEEPEISADDLREILENVKQKLLKK